MLTGADLIAKIREFQPDVSKDEIIRACGYVSKDINGKERLHYKAWYDAVFEAKGWNDNKGKENEEDNNSKYASYYLGILALPEDFNEDELKKAYRREAMKWHPDKNPNDDYATERLKLVNESYEFLSNQINN